MFQNQRIFFKEARKVFQLSYIGSRLVQNVFKKNVMSKQNFVLYLKNAFIMIFFLQLPYWANEEIFGLDLFEKRQPYR